MTDNRQSVDQPLPTADDAWLDSLLRQDAAAAPYVEDAGFTAAVVQRLPERSPHRWIVPGMGLLGFLVGLVWLSGGENLSLSLASLAFTKSLSLQSILIAALPLGLLYWLALGAAWRER